MAEPWPCRRACSRRRPGRTARAMPRRGRVAAPTPRAVWPRRPRSCARRWCRSSSRRSTSHRRMRRPRLRRRACSPTCVAVAQNPVTAFAAALTAKSESTEKDKPSADGWMSALGDLAAKRSHDVAPAVGPRLSTPVHDARWADALAHRLVMMARDGESTRIAQTRAAWTSGPLDIQITVRDGEASVHFGAAQPGNPRRARSIDAAVARIAAAPRACSSRMPACRSSRAGRTGPRSRPARVPSARWRKMLKWLARRSSARRCSISTRRRAKSVSGGT